VLASCDDAIVTLHAPASRSARRLDQTAPLAPPLSLQLNSLNKATSDCVDGHGDRRAELLAESEGQKERCSGAATHRWRNARPASNLNG
jgi:hypothetical protein